MRVENLSSFNHTPTKKVPSFKASYQSQSPILNGTPHPKKTNLANSLYHQAIVATHIKKAEHVQNNLDDIFTRATAVQNFADPIRAKIAKDIDNAAEIIGILEDTTPENKPENIDIELEDGYFKCRVKDEDWEETFLETTYYVNATTMSLSSIEKTCIMQNHKSHILYHINFEDKETKDLKDATRPIHYTSEEYIDANTPDNEPRYRMEYMFDGKELRGYKSSRISLEDYDDGVEEESYQFRNGELLEATTGHVYDKKGKKIYAFKEGRLKSYSFEKFVENACRDFELKGYHAYYYNKNANVEKIALDHEGYNPNCLSAGKVYEIKGKNILFHKNAMVHQTQGIFATDTVAIK